MFSIPRLILRCSLLIVLTSSTLALASGALGAAQPPNPVLAGFSEGCHDKPQPCWYGILPGTTSIKEARSILDRLPIAYWVYQHKPPQPGDTFASCSAGLLQDQTPDMLVISIRLDGCQEDLRLEKVMGVLGSPNNIYSCNIFTNQVALKDLPPDDYFLKITLSAYDGLILNDNWNSYIWYMSSFDPQHPKFDPVEVTTIACGEG